jgi:hypothetical protein
MQIQSLIVLSMLSAITTQAMEIRQSPLPNWAGTAEGLPSPCKIF